MGCRKIQPKREMVRIVKTLDGIEIEKDERLSGRGAYLHQDRICWEKAIAKKLAAALKTNLSSNDKETLLEYMKTIATKPENEFVES
ncbi:MAG: YlxR family protein [Chloroflexota bacterium]